MSALSYEPGAKQLNETIANGDVVTALHLLSSTPELATGHDGGGWTPLMSACRIRNVELIQKLLLLGANVHQRNLPNPKNGEGDNFALWFTANQKQPNRVEVAKLLVEHGAMVNAVGEFGETPLHQAAAWDNADIAEYLISVGANVNAEIISGKHPLSLAVKYNFEDVAKVLRAYGAREMS